MMAIPLKQKTTGIRRRGAIERFCARPLVPIVGLISGLALPVTLALPVHAQTAPPANMGAGPTPPAATVPVPVPATPPNTEHRTPNTLVNPLVDEKGNALTVPQVVMGVGSSAPVAITSPGIGALETLRGNGGRTGYALAHNPIIPDSLSIYVGGKRLKLNEDYWLDASSGGLYFAVPLRASDSISVAYRYLEGEAAKSQQRSAAGLQLNLDASTHLNLLYGLNSRQENGASLANERPAHGQSVRRVRQIPL